jgi:hypothetical protein
MKHLIILILLFMSGSAFAQSSTFDSTYTAKNGHLFHIGDTLQLGMGSNSNKDFVFIFTSPMSLAGVTYLGSAWTGLSVQVKSIKTITSKKMGKKTYLICGGGNIVNYWCDIEPAILTGEVIAK